MLLLKTQAIPPRRNPLRKKTARNYLAAVTDVYEYLFKEQLLGMYMKVEPEQMLQASRHQRADDRNRPLASVAIRALDVGGVVGTHAPATRLSVDLNLKMYFASNRGHSLHRCHVLYPIV